jgi:hypothetical protein
VSNHSESIDRVYSSDMQQQIDERASLNKQIEELKHDLECAQLFSAELMKIMTEELEQVKAMRDSLQAQLDAKR